MVPMMSVKRGGSPPRSRRNHSAKAKNSASPVPAVDSAASLGSPLPHSAGLRGNEDTNSEHDAKLQPSGHLPVGGLATARSQSAGGTGITHTKSSGVTALDEMVMERLHSLAEEGADASTPKNGILQCDVRWQAVAVCSAVVVLVFVFVTALLVRRWSFGPRMLQRKPACDKPGCQHVASEILSRLDHSVDPCDDIEAHVCGPIKWESDLVTDTATHMMRQWKKRGALYLESKRRPHAAFALYEACMHPHGDSVLELKAFMRERRLSWPEYRSMGRHALYVLLDLLINWGVPFWFEMSLRCLPNETRYSLYINRVKMNQWRRQQQISADQGRLMQYAVQFYDIFNASQAARTRIPTLLRLEKEIHAVIEPSEKGEDDAQVPTVAQVPLRVASVFTPNITTDMWLSFLNEHLRPYHFQASDHILIDDFSLTKIMNTLFLRFSNEDMLYTLGWWFAQQFTVVTSLDGGVVSYGSVALAQANRPVDCYALAESRFLRQLFLERARASLGAVGMLHVENILENIRNTTISMLGPVDCYALAESRFLRQLFLERARASLGAVGMFHVENTLENIRNTTISMLGPVDCYALAESRFLRQLRARASLGAVGMFHVENTLENIRNTTISMLGSLAWMDKETRSEAAAIVAATRFEAWQSDVADAAVDQASDQIFEKKRVGHDNRELKKALPHTVHQKRFMGRQTSLSLPVDVGGNVSGKRAIETTEREWLRLSNSTVIERWIKAAVDYKSRVPGWPVNDSLQNRHLSYAQLAHYEYWWNSLFLQMGAFAEPLFFLDAASLSANYAGLGFVVARHLEKAFDLKWGAQLDVSRKKRNWMSSASRSAYEGKLACTGGNDRVLSHIVALEIALAAAFGSEMGHENGAEPKDLRYSLPLQSETFTSEMVFFLIYCRVTCGSTLGCGDVLRRVEHFGKAFGCPANSRMTSAPKCSFFGK